MSFSPNRGHSWTAISKMAEIFDGENLTGAIADAKIVGDENAASYR